MSDQNIPRRRFLQGMGTLVALPMLDIFTPSRASAQSAVAPPSRMIFMSAGCGIYDGEFFYKKSPGFDQPYDAPMAAWRPAAVGSLANQTMPLLLRKFDSNKNDFSVISGMYNPTYRDNGNDYGGHNTNLTALSCEFVTSASPFRAKNSLDQIVGHAHQAKYGYKFDSLNFTPVSWDQVDSPFDVGLKNCMSYWNGGLVPRYRQPIDVYNSIFAGLNPSQTSIRIGMNLTDKRSVIDFVKDNAQRLIGKLGKEDKVRMEQYFDSIRSVETRILASDTGAVVASCKKPNAPPGAIVENDTNENHYERMYLVYDMILMAMQCNLTSVATVMVDREQAHRYMPYINPAEFLNTKMTQHHHELSHLFDQAKASSEPDYMRGLLDYKNQLIQIKLQEFNQFKYLIDKAKAIVEPNGGTLLDNSQIMMFYGMNSGSMHETKHMPVFLAGRGGGLKQGQHIDATNVSVANLYLTMMQKAGMNVTSFAGATRGIPELG